VKAQTADGVCGSLRTFPAYYIDMTWCGLVSPIELSIGTKVLNTVSLEDIVSTVRIDTKLANRPLDQYSVARGLGLILLSRAMRLEIRRFRKVG
jgi:hypothetical protein